MFKSYKFKFNPVNVTANSMREAIEKLQEYVESPEFVDEVVNCENWTICGGE